MSEQEQETPDCGCAVGRDSSGPRITYCPTHAAAPAMRKALEAAEAPRSPHPVAAQRGRPGAHDMNGEHDARPTDHQPSPDPDSDSGLPVLAVAERSRHERQVAALARADGEPTLADAEQDLRKLEAALWLMDRWDLGKIKHAIALARNRVRGARRRQGYDHKD